MQHEFGGNAAVLTLEVRRWLTTDYHLLPSQKNESFFPVEKLAVSVLHITDA